jgi:hypothetical protein
LLRLLGSISEYDPDIYNFKKSNEMASISSKEYDFEALQTIPLTEADQTEEKKLGFLDTYLRYNARISSVCMASDLIVLL